jgi:hypothetical protein
MKISEVQALIKEASLPKAARELEVGRDRLQAFLKANGFEHKRGTK